MVRIYYKLEVLAGKPYENKIISIKLFNFIFDNTNCFEFEIIKKILQKIVLKADGIHYKNANYGSFYL